MAIRRDESAVDYHLRMAKACHSRARELLEAAAGAKSPGTAAALKSKALAEFRYSDRHRQIAGSAAAHDDARSPSAHIIIT